jgi:hypothetical protein
MSSSQRRQSRFVVCRRGFRPHHELAIDRSRASGLSASRSDNAGIKRSGAAPMLGTSSPGGPRSVPSVTPNSTEVSHVGGGGAHLGAESPTLVSFDRGVYELVVKFTDAVLRSRSKSCYPWAHVAQRRCSADRTGLMGFGARQLRYGSLNARFSATGRGNGVTCWPRSARA